MVTLRVTNYGAIPLIVKRVYHRFRVENDLDVKGQETKNVTFQKKGTELRLIHVKSQPKSIDLFPN